MCDRSPNPAGILMAAAAFVGLFTAPGCAQNRWLSRYDYSEMHDPCLESPPALAAADSAKRHRRGAGSVRLGEIGGNTPGSVPGVAAAGAAPSALAPKPLPSAQNPFIAAGSAEPVAQASYPDTDANPFEQLSHDTTQAHYENAADGQSAFAVRQTAGIAEGHAPGQQENATDGLEFSGASARPLRKPVADRHDFADDTGVSLWDAPFPGPPSGLPENEIPSRMMPSATAENPNFGSTPPPQFDAGIQPEPLFEHGTAPTAVSDEGFWDPVTGSPDAFPPTNEHAAGRAVMSPSSSQKLDGRFGPEGSWKPSNFVRP